MAQAPNTPSSGSRGGSASKVTPKSTGRASKGTKGSRVGKGTGKVKEPLLTLANVVPAHHAKHAMSGEYTTKGKFANWTDGQEAFK